MDIKQGEVKTVGLRGSALDFRRKHNKEIQCTLVAQWSKCEWSKYVSWATVGFTSSVSSHY